MSNQQELSIKKFKENVRKARQYVNNYDKVRFVIAGLAQEVCDLSHGGRKVDGVFSIANFATHCEINPKTLYDWIRIKRNVADKLPKVIQDNIHLESYQNLREVDMISTPEDDKNEIYEKLKFVKAKDPQEAKLIKYNKNLKSVLFSVSRPLLIENVTEATLLGMISLLDNIKAKILEELNLRKTLSATERKVEKLNIPKEVAKRLNLKEESVNV